MAAFDSPVAKALSPLQILPLLVAFSSIAANLEGVKAFCFRQEKVVYLYPQFWQQNSLCCEVKPFPGALSLSLWVPCGYLITTLVLSHPCWMGCLVVTGIIPWVSQTLYHFSFCNSVKSCWRRKSDTSIFLHWPTQDTPKYSCFCASLSGKWWELPALRITLYLYYITAINCFSGEERIGVAIQKEVVPFSVLQKCWCGRSWCFFFFCNFYKYTAKRKGHFGNILTFWLSCFQFKPWVESWTGDHIKT